MKKLNLPMTISLLVLLFLSTSFIAYADVYYPHIACTSKWDSEICVINTSTGTVKGIFEAYDDAGNDVLDNIEVTLPPHARKQITVGSQFSSPSSIGYIIFKTDSKNVVGYTKFYIDGQYRVAVPAISKINTGDLYISHIASNDNWWTGISIVNTTSAPKTLIIKFDNGSEKTVPLAGKEHHVFNIKSLFGYIPQPDLHSAVIQNADGVVGLELFSSGKRLSGILLKNDTTKNMYYPHIASGKKWWTGIVAYNPSASNCKLTINPYKTDGTALVSQEVELNAYEKYIGTITTLKLPTDAAWFAIKAEKPITGFELFGTSDGNLLAGYTGVNISSKEGVFAKIEKNGWTGIAFVNIESGLATVNLTAYDNSGKVIDTKSISLSAHEKMVDNPKNIFSKNIDKATYISYSSDHELVGFQLNCSPDASDDMMLDGLPGLFAGSSDSSCKNVLLSDDFSGSLTTNWTTGTRTNKYNNPPRNPTVKIVDGEVKYSQLYDYIETRKSFSGNFKVQMDVSRLIGSHGCADYYIELVGLDHVAAIMRFSYGLYAKESINIGRPPVDGETGADSFDCIDYDPSYLEELDHHGEAKGVLTLTYDTGKVQVSYTNDEGDTITTLWMSTGTFSSTKVRIWGLGSKGGERYLDNIKICSLDDSGQPPDPDDCEETELLNDSFNGSLTTNWTTGTNTYNNPEGPTVKIVEGEVKYSQLYDYIETRKSFSGNFKVQMDVSRLIGSHGCADYYVELVGLNRVAAIMRFSYGLDAKESINIGRPPVDGETGAGTFDCIRDPSYLEELDHHGEAKGVLTLTYDTGKVQVSYTNDEGDTITTLWMSTGTFSSTKVRIWGLGSKGGERYIDNVKIISLCGADGDDGGDNGGGGDGGSCSNSVTFKLNGQSTTIPIFDMGESGFLLGYGDFYACHFSPTSSSGATQLFINDIPNTVSAGKTYAYTEEDVSTDGAISILWENNMYVGVNCTTTFTKWEGDGGNAEGTFSAEVYSPVSGKTMMITDGSFCAPIHDTY